MREVAFVADVALACLLEVLAQRCFEQGVQRAHGGLRPWRAPEEGKGRGYHTRHHSRCDGRIHGCLLLELLEEGGEHLLSDE